MSRRSSTPRAALAAVLITLLTVLVSASAVGAQAVPDAEIIKTDLSEFPTVRLSVALSGDAAVTSIGADDVVVTENGEVVEAEVQGLSDETLDVVLAIDVSGSMAGEPLAQAKVASLQFIDELPDNARVAIVSFGDSADLVSGFTTNRASSRDAVNALSSGGETALYDSVVLASQQIGASDASRSSVIVLSDGGDTISDTDLEGAAESLSGTETDFFAVSLQSGEADEVALNTLADAADGSVVAATDPDALSAAYVDLGQRIANQYDIVFESVTEAPTATFAVAVGDTEASIEVALPDRETGASPTSEAAVREVTPLTGRGTAGALEQSWALWAGALLVAVALAITAYVVLPDSGNRPRRRSLGSDRVPVDDGSSAGQRLVGSVRESATRFTSRAVERSEQGSTIDAALDRAGLVMRAGEFVAAVIGIAIVAGFLLFLLMGIVGLAIGVLVPTLGAPTALKFLAKRRNKKFAEQLSDTLLLIAGSLRSGFGIGQAMDSVAEEMEDPMGAEFGRAVLETRLGRDMEDALDGIAGRVQNEDFEWVVDAMRIHRQVGGDLAQILDKVSETIRARNRLRRQIDALTAEGRLSGLVLGSLPIGMALVLYSTNPDYLKPLFESTAGFIMVGVAVTLLITGVVWLRKLIDVEL
ncbi:type II secretion system F family protein [Actinospongicola halichondriae]|uniref:type II secretion system F family protein n=1 Tax=Actinospongicola halichondriae TaxID=3236844 RepID=UPI003D455EF9